MPALRADFDPTREKLTIARKPVNPFLGWAMTFPFNMLSRCPVLAMLSGQAKTGVPTGIQIVGRTYRDADVFQAAAAFEALDPWYGQPARRPKL